MRVHLLRHGETENPGGIVYGARPFPLTALGIEQAEAAGIYLGKKFGDEEAVWMSSPVRRAQSTASFAHLTSGAALANPLRTDPDLTEAISMFDGKRVPEVAALRRNWKRLTDPHTPSWGEPYADIEQRMSRALSRAVETGAAHVVLVSHQLPIWILRLALEGRPYAHDPALRQCGHASVTTLTIEGGAVTELNYWQNPTH